MDRKATCAAAAFAAPLLAASPASAHIKWFCAYDVAGQPEGLANVLCQDFFSLILLSTAFLLWACLLDRSVLGPMVISLADRVTAPLRRDSEKVMRATMGFFFVSLWAVGGIMLTPEITTTSPAVPWVQLGMAACLLWRRTMVLTAVGMVVLFGMAVRGYGTFHLLDYPIFLGIAAYLAMTGLGMSPKGFRPLDVVRWAAAVTLMWASIEKWAYPEWTMPLLDRKPGMTLGFDEAFYMRAAGAIEFTLAFCLLWSPLLRRASALFLAATFVLAVFGFGKVDAIGHAPIVAVLLAIVADDQPERFEWRRASVMPASYLGALATTLLAYYGAHAAIYGAGHA